MAAAGHHVYVVHQDPGVGPSRGFIFGIFADNESAESAVKLERSRGQLWDITDFVVQTGSNSLHAFEEGRSNHHAGKSDLRN
jgi:hypothetical protein